MSAPPPVAVRPENLALVFQEILTAIVRVRSDRQALTDVGSFRTHMREAVRKADQDGRERGYSDDIMRIARFSVVAFLDESILNSRNALFADWSRKPLQEELFGVHIAGEIFFQNLDRLLAQSDSEMLADVLEVYQLCLLLGFGGRYSAGGRGELRAIRESVAAKIRRIRGYAPDLSPAWAVPAGGAPSPKGDPWVRKLLYGALACFVLALVLFTGFKLALGSGVSDLSALAARGR
jgi:type VI secretion system protein ImpK